MADSSTTAQDRSETTGNSQLPQKPAFHLAKSNIPVPKALVDAGEFGENIYDAVKTDDWNTADQRLSDLRLAVKTLNSDKIGSGELNIIVGNLEKLISGKNKKATLLQSNKFTFDVAELSSQYALKVPVEVTKLDYLGRELEIWSREKDIDKLKHTADEIRQTWHAVKAKVEANDGMKEAVVFEDLVRKTETAISVSDFAKLATPILDEVDNLEIVFVKNRVKTK